MKFYKTRSIGTFFFVTVINFREYYVKELLHREKNIMRYELGRVEKFRACLLKFHCFRLENLIRVQN